jgi:hypothetical protein
MKILALCFMFLVFVNITAVLNDMLLGAPFLKAIKNSLNPFYVIETGEIVFLIIFLIVSHLNLAFAFLKRKQQAPK